MTYSYFERLSALDGSFLAIENGASHMHIGSVAIFEAGPFVLLGILIWLGLRVRRRQSETRLLEQN